MRGVTVMVWISWPRLTFSTTGLPPEPWTTLVMGSSADSTLPLASRSRSPRFRPAARAGELATTSATSLVMVSLPQLRNMIRAITTADR